MRCENKFGLIVANVLDCMEYKKVLVVCCLEIMTLVTIFSSYPHLLVTFFLFVEAAKELRRERKKGKDIFKLNFYFGGL